MSATRTFNMGKHELELGGKYLGSLRDSNDLLGDFDALRARMEEDGFLLLRGLQPREKVIAARRRILESLDADGKIDHGYPLMDAVIQPGGGAWKGQKESRASKEFLDLVESPEIRGFFEGFLGEPVRTFDFKWLRAMGPGGNSGAHYDIVYMGRGTQNLYTVWTPIGDLTLDHGTLIVLRGSHKLEPFQKIRETYGKMDVDRDNIEGWFSRDPIEMVDRFGGQWQTTEFRMGDVIIFGMFTMHGSINNVTNRFRLSCDTRWQRASEPVDERWVGETVIGHSQRGDKSTPMSEARKKWGV